MVVAKFDYIKILNDHAKFVVAKDYDPNGDLDAQQEEEDFLSEVADSVGKLGNWCMQLYLNHEKILKDNKELCDYYLYMY